MRWLLSSLLVYVAISSEQQVAPAPAPPLLTPSQAKFIADAQVAAAQASQDAEKELLEAFNSPRFRLQLLAQGRGALGLVFKPASELLEMLKDALHSLEFLFSFGLDPQSAKLHPGQPAWSLKGIDDFGHIPTLWELKVAGEAKALPPAQWKLVDAEETGLYHQPEFAKPADPNMTEAANRPSYISGNLVKFDAGIWEFGVFAPVYRQSALKERAVVASQDGGAWETVCNASAAKMNVGFRIFKYIMPCNAIFAGGPKPNMIFGTVDHLLHTFRSSTKIFGIMGEDLARRTYQLLSPDATMHPLEDNMYMEAVFFGPARTEDLKLFVASFPDVYGTPQADELRAFCKRHGLPLAWAMGGGKMRRDLDKRHHFMWLPYEPLVHWQASGDRLLDVSSWDVVNAQAPPGAAAKWAAVDAEAKKVRPLGTEHLDHKNFASWWSKLKEAGGTVHQLRGKDCATKVDLCFGTSGDTNTAGQCLCRQFPGSAAPEPEALVI